MSASPRRCSPPRSARASPTAASTGSSRARFRRQQDAWRSSTSPSSARSRRTVIEHLGQLDFLHGKENVILLGPPGTGKTHLAIAIGIRACLAGHRVAFATATQWVARLAEAQREGRLEAELRTPRPHSAAGRRRGRLHPLRPRGGQPDVRADLGALRARLDDRHLEQALLAPGGRSSATKSSPRR